MEKSFLTGIQKSHTGKGRTDELDPFRICDFCLAKIKVNIGMTDWVLLFPVSRTYRELLQIIKEKTTIQQETKMGKTYENGLQMEDQTEYPLTECIYASPH